jgi:hypothetical protein
MGRIVAAAGGAGVLTALLAKSWAVALALAVVVVAVAVVLVAVGAMCWIVNDPDRPGRLALIMRAWRGQELPAPSSATAVSVRPAAVSVRPPAASVRPMAAAVNGAAESAEGLQEFVAGEVVAPEVAAAEVAAAEGAGAEGAATPLTPSVA